jgi:hypothetical protein
MTKGVQISYLWHDVDVIKIRVRIENDDFSGAADLYVGHGDLRAAGKKLKGFPKDSRDERQFELGSFGDSPAGGGAVQLSFRCKDLAGHTALEARIEADSDAASRPQAAFIRANFEPAALDRFIEELSEFDQDISVSNSKCASLAIL